MLRPFSWASLILLTIATAMVVPSTPQASAATYAPGVSPGDWVKYGQVSGFWYIPFQDPPQFIKDAMATNWVTTEAVSVVDNDVTAAQTWNFDNATCQRSVTLTGNVQTGSGNLTIFIIGGGLKAGDPINAMPLAPTLNKTITWSYVGAARQVNVLNYTSSQSTAFGILFLQILLFWDQITGVLLESSFVEQITSVLGTYMGVTHILITETNLWQAQLQPDFTITAQPASLVLEPGATDTSIICVSSIDGYSGNVRLTSTVDPENGLSVSLPFTSVNLEAEHAESFQIVLSAAPTANSGTYTAIVLGEDDLLSSRSASVTVVVNSPVSSADFEISAYSALTVVAGSSDTATVTVTQIDGFTGTVTLAATVSPSGPNVSLEPTSVSWSSAYGYASSRLTVSVPSSTPAGTYAITITGSSGSKSHSITIPLTVNRSIPPPTTQSSPNTQPTFGLPTIALTALALVLAVTVVAVVSFLVSRKPEPSPEF